MVRSIHKTNILFGVAGIIALVSAFVGLSSGAKATDQNFTFNVNLKEVLTVSLTKPTIWASGNVDTLLRNKVTVSALTNNYYGATVSMYANDTMLQNITSYSSTDPTSYIPNLTSNTTNGSFTPNAWGYSITDNDAGISSAAYLPITTSASPVTLITRSTGTTGTTYSKDVFFGAKATSAKQAGTYWQTVNFVAVTGVIDTDNPVNPTNPSSDVAINNTPTYTSSTNRTTYTTRSTNASTNTTNTTTQIMPGNTTGSYANAAGVVSKSGDGSGIIIVLATAATVAAASGIFFFVLAKRRNDDDEEEEE